MLNYSSKEMKGHWNRIYESTPTKKLGWYEENHDQTLRLLDQTTLDKRARLLITGAGSTTLVDELLRLNYTNIIATDISNVALTKLKLRISSKHVSVLVDDLTCPTTLRTIKAVDLWLDRAVLHFLTQDAEKQAYIHLLKQLLKKGGYVLLAQFSLEGAEKCSGLPIHRYSTEMLEEQLGIEFKLVDSFEYSYTMYSGDLRPYVYALFLRV